MSVQEENGKDEYTYSSPMCLHLNLYFSVLETVSLELIPYVFGILLGWQINLGFCSYTASKRYLHSCYPILTQPENVTLTANKGLR